MSKVSRRDCLKSAFTIIPAISARTYAANERINVASIGMGAMGAGNIGRMISLDPKQHVAGSPVQPLPINLVAMCDVDNRDPIQRNPRKTFPEFPYKVPPQMKAYKGPMAQRFKFRRRIARSSSHRFRR